MQAPVFSLYAHLPHVPLSLQVGGFEGGKWHFDKFTEPATHRQANYYGNTGSLRLRYGGVAGSLQYEGVVVTIIAPLVRQLTLKPRGPSEGQHQTQSEPAPLGECPRLDSSFHA